MALYAAKCFWPGITTDEFKRHAADWLVQMGPASPQYLGSMLFDEDALVLCLFDGGSSAAVRHVAELVHVPCERVMHSVWLPGEPAGTISSLSGRGEP